MQKAVEDSTNAFNRTRKIPLLCDYFNFRAVELI